jgi:glycosyltransferase involved in cell wall biosynthesis
MRIAMISTPFVSVPPRDYGGTELVVYELVEGLLDRGHDVTLFAPGSSRTRARLHALYPSPQWPPDPATDLNHVSWAMAQVARGKYDVVHTHSSAALAFGRLLPHLPMVYTLHHVREAELSAYYQYFREVEFVAISHDQCARESGVDRCTVIHHGLDSAQYRWTDRPEPYVCFVGRLAREKGPHTAIEAAALAGVPLRMAGDVHPQDREYFQSMVEPRLAAPGVTFLGPVGPAQKIPLLRNARALVAPIEWNEPFGLILIEAMLSGCPVVAFARGSVPELVQQGLTGFTAASLEEMAQLIRPGGPVDRLDRRRIRVLAARRFSRERMVAEYERVYGLAAAKRLGASPRPITAA